MFVFIPQKRTAFAQNLRYVQFKSVLFVYRGFSWQPCWRAETMKQFCMEINLIFQSCFCPPTWRQWRNMKTLYSEIIRVRVVFRKTDVGDWCFDSWAVVIFRVKWTVFIRWWYLCLWSWFSLVIIGFHWPIKTMPRGIDTEPKSAWPSLPPSYCPPPHPTLHPQELKQDSVFLLKPTYA